MPIEPARRELSQRELDLLAFERDWTAWQGDKDAQIRQRFGFSAARYYQLLARLVADPAARAHDPLLTARLRRRREERSRRRTAAELGIGPGR